MNLLAGLLGVVLIAVTAVELFETIVLPRRVTRRFRLVRLYYRGISIPWQWAARRFPSRREGIMSVLGPLSLLLLVAIWALGMILGFALLQWASGSDLAAGAGADPSFGDDLYFSATTFLTLGLGDLVPHGGTARLLTALEASGGFVVLALVIGYLPSLYQAFARREAAVSQLDSRAGSPPSAGQLVLGYARDGDWGGLTEYLRQWEAWAADLMESHLSYPVLTLFRSQHDNQSWLAVLATILDTCALVFAGLPDVRRRPAKQTYTLCRHFAIDLAQILYVPLTSSAVDRLPAEDLARLRAQLAEAGAALTSAETMETTLSGLRAGYEPYLHALSRRLLLPLPEWLPPPTPTDPFDTPDRLVASAASKRRRRVRLRVRA
jgi:hypothetical protein